MSRRHVSRLVFVGALIAVLAFAGPVHAQAADRGAVAGLRGWLAGLWDGAVAAIWAGSEAQASSGTEGDLGGNTTEGAGGQVCRVDQGPCIDPNG